MNELTRPGGILPRLWFAMRANRAFRFQVYLAAFLAITMLGRCADLLRERLQRSRAAAAAITPITSLTASRPTELGGSTSGSLYASADRIDIYARTSSSTATLNLVEYLPDDGKWVKHGADCAVTTDLTLCRYVAKRGARYWHVYKASGSMAYVGIEQAYNQGASLGSIEPSGPGISLPLGVSDGGTGLTGFTANRLLYSSSTSAIGQLGCSDGQVPTWSSGAIVCATPASNGNCTILATVWDGGITTA